MVKGREKKQNVKEENEQQKNGDNIYCAGRVSFLFLIISLFVGICLSYYFGKLYKEAGTFKNNRTLPTDRAIKFTRKKNCLPPQSIVRKN
mmetsp:Transcript_36575/g.41728  ORF Transcript_36575/g.41728 Transcript_36575/m.41728 type:complete len:90 (+) Transcript_36575:85-354(+)